MISAIFPPSQLHLAKFSFAESLAKHILPQRDFLALCLGQFIETARTGRRIGLDHIFVRGAHWHGQSPVCTSCQGRGGFVVRVLFICLFQGSRGIHHARMRKIRTKATGRALHQASPAGKGIASQRRIVAQRPGNGTTKGIGNELNFVIS